VSPSQTHVEMGQGQGTHRERIAPLRDKSVRDRWIRERSPPESSASS